ncbi:MAG: ankyrin repeat domain-containing protein [Pirellulaceae bacterium]
MRLEYRFLEAVRQGDIDDVRTAHSLGVDINAKDIDRKTALELCEEFAENAIALELIQFGCDTGIRIGAFADTLLHRAVRRENYGFAMLLLGSGFPVDTPNNRGDTATHIAASKHNEFLMKLLLAHSADVNIENLAGNTPLHVAARNGNSVVVRHLVNAGAAVNSTNARKRTPLDEAIGSRHEETIRKLRSYGGERQADCDRPLFKMLQ